MIASKSDLHAILNSFPNNLSYAFGYGSGVFSQQSRHRKPLEQENDTAIVPGVLHDNDGEKDDATSSETMIDVILSTKCTKTWHSENLVRNPMHYSSMSRILGPDFIEIVQNWGAGVYFNPMVQILGANHEKRLVKYGVISEKRLKYDLRHWESIYIAGRLQKPTFTLCSCDEILQLQEEYNLRYALSAALLIMPQSKCTGDDKRIRMEDVFESIAGLSYLGDPRISTGAEDPNKVKKLVHAPGQMDRFHGMYNQQFRQLEEIGLLSLTNDIVHVNLMEVSTRKALYKRLPPQLQFETRSPLYDQHHQASDLGVGYSYQRSRIMDSISKIVAPSARIQSAKGLVTAGLSKSVRYAAAKLAKGSLNGII
jgi:Mitochondrial matrix Mmp37.